MQLTPHFSLEEMTISQTASRLGIKNIPTADIIENLTKLAEKLELIRRFYDGKPIIISSGYRSPKLNKAVGGSPRSQHMRGQAVDFTIPGISIDTIICDLRETDLEFDQLIHEFNSWVHLSISPTPRYQVLKIDRNGTREIT